VSAARVHQVYRELERWGAWTKRRRPRPRLDRLDADTIIRFIRDRNVCRSKSTITSNLSVMRGMGEFLVQEGIWTTNPLRWIRGPKRDPRARLPQRIDRPCMKRLWEAAATGRFPYYRYLWVAVLAVLYGTGIRRGELSRLDISDWDRDPGLLRVDGRKTGRQRCVPVPDMVGHCIEAYLPHRHNQLERWGVMEQTALFVKQDGGRIGAAAISKGMHRIAQRANTSLISLHQFRHTCASDLLEAGLTLPVVKELLGHQTVTTTVRYLEISDPQRVEAIRRHPVNEWLSPHESR
jgi:site-specific recombinase XerD